ncbi:sensor histidine kinase [Streptomyces fulvoviolaceus]|uniref:sensor histidine kinase n=1 Tax=Streptomyces fulvoviolaceus TaxID=285535 RepID=UPI0004C8EAFF|nr:sensor histidine kinase [Streptomyces fulvoviolaceus]MCT9075743.1 sensor histidine kinase [Streptomyces fulvoviolaceus]
MSLPWQRYADDHARTVDTMTAAVLFACFLFGSEIHFPNAAPPEAVGPTIALAAVACGSLFWQRSRPRTVVAVTALCSAGAVALGDLLTPLLLGPLMLALYRLALATDRGTTRIAFFATLALVTIAAFTVDPLDHPWPLKTLGPVAWLLLPVATGNGVRLRRAYVEAIQARAEYAERSREEEARHRVAEERMRIARELHDVVAHHLALANAQAGTAAHLARTHPAQVERILTDLAGTTSSALREMKATVGLLRQADDPAAPLAPSPGLGQLPELTDAFGSAGLTVHVSTEGSPRTLSPGVDLTAYRIVQEALTNVAKHAGAGAARVRLRYRDDQLTITVTDDGAPTAPAAPAPGQGFGLIGMRERARSVGGALQAGRRPEGGFEVTTRLPLYPTAPEREERTP